MIGTPSVGYGESVDAVLRTRIGRSSNRLKSAPHLPPVRPSSPPYCSNADEMRRDIPDADLPIPGANELLKLYCEEMGRPYPLEKWVACCSFSFFRVRLPVPHFSPLFDHATDEERNSCRSSLKESQREQRGVKLVPRRRMSMERSSSSSVRWRWTRSSVVRMLNYNLVAIKFLSSGAVPLPWTNERAGEMISERDGRR